MKKGIGIVFMLAFVVILSSVAVFFVEDITTPIIDDRQREQIQAAVEEVFPDIKGTTWDVIDSTLDFSGTPITGAKEIKDGDSLVGIVYTVVFRGFSSDITYVVGVDRQGAITGYKTISQNDTAGYGAQIADAENWAQFTGLLLETAGNGGFDGLTGASVTTGGWKQSFADLYAYHKDAGVFPELTQEQKDQLLFKSIIGDGFTYTAVEDINQFKKDLDDYGIDRAYEATDGTTDYAIYYEVFDGFNPGTEVIVVVDKDTHNVAYFQAVKSMDTVGYGQAIMDPANWTQFTDKTQTELFEGDFDGISGATGTTNGWKDAMMRISMFHQARYQGNIKYTTSELKAIYQEQLSVDFTASTELVEVTDQKIANILIANIYDVKNSFGDIEGTVYYVSTLGAYQNGPTVIQFLVGVDPAGNYTGLRILETTDTQVKNSAMFITQPSTFDTPGYFGEEIEGMSVTSTVTLTPIAGLEAQTTSIQNALNEVGRYHDEDYPKRDDVVILDQYLQPTFPTATSFTSIYSDYDYKNGVVNVYEAYDATNALLGYVYAGKYEGREGEILYTLGVGLDGVTTSINVYKSSETWDQAAYDGYNGSEGTNFPTSPWLDNFGSLDVANFVASYTPSATVPYGESSMIDSVSGVSTTTGGDNTHYGLIDSVYTVLKFHVDNSVGGAD